MRSRRIALLVALGAVVLAACATAGGPTAQAPAPGMGLADGTAERDAAADTALKQPPGGPAQQVPNSILFQSDRVLILTASLDVRHKDAWATADRIQAIAVGLGGDVVAMGQSGQGDDRAATVTVRVPNERFDEALSQIRGIADIEVRNAKVTGEDRTEQFIDLEARLKAKQAEEQRYLALLGRANTIDDILKIDGVLSNVRAQIEQLQGQVNFLRNRSTLATITVSVSTLVIGPSSQPNAWQPGRTFETAVASLIAFMRVVGDVLIWALVWAWLPALAVLAGGALLRGRSRPTQPPA